MYSHGSNFGLSFLIDHKSNDYGFAMNSFTGTVVLIFDGLDFPDQLSGAVREKIISPRQEVYLSLHPTLIRGSRSMTSFDVDSRNCVFNHEINLVFDKWELKWHSTLQIMIKVLHVPVSTASVNVCIPVVLPILLKRVDAYHLISQIYSIRLHVRSAIWHV